MDAAAEIRRNPVSKHQIQPEAVYYGVRIETSTLSEFNKSSQVPTTRKKF